MQLAGRVGRTLAVVGLLATAWVACTTSGRRASDDDGDGGSTSASTGVGGSSAVGSGTSTATSTASSTSSSSSTSASSSSSGSGGPGCDAATLAPSNGSCVTLTGAGGGAGFAFECNPVTNAPCAAGSSCDLAQGGFQCFPNGAADDQVLCESCDQANGPYCIGTLTCLLGDTCQRYCCDDGDCGTGVCTKDDGSGNALVVGAPSLGICQPM